MMDISISLDNKEINEAITEYIASKGADIAKKKVTILAVAGRKGSGIRAEILISPPNPDKETPTEEQVDIEEAIENSETDDDRQEVYDNSTDAEETLKPASATGSLFSKETA